MRIPAENAKARIDRMYDVDLLIIDDLGTEIISRTTTAFLFNLIDTRPVSYTHLTLPTNREVLISVVVVSLTKKRQGHLTKQ